jgi:hypothetical protein
MQLSVTSRPQSTSRKGLAVHYHSLVLQRKSLKELFEYGKKHGRLSAIRKRIWRAKARQCATIHFLQWIQVFNESQLARRKQYLSTALWLEKNY